MCKDLLSQKMNGSQVKLKPVVLHVLLYSDESEPSWLEPELKLKDFQLGSARDIFPSARNKKSAENEPNF